jgi:hypothetical protein
VLRRDLLTTLLGLLPISGALSRAVAVATAATDVVERVDLDGKRGTGDADRESTTADADGEPSDDHPRTRTAVVDRIEGDVAVLLFEDGTDARTVPLAVLPPAAREAGIVLRVPEGNSVALATVDRAATARRRRAAGDRFDDLAEPAPGRGNGGNGTAPDPEDGENGTSP